MKTALKAKNLNGTAHSAIKPPPRKVWRARIHANELDQAGFNKPEADQFAILQGLLRLKGIPEHHLGEGRAFRGSVDPKTGVLTVEFKDA